MLDVRSARSLLRRSRPRRHADGYPRDVRAQATRLARSLMASGQSRNGVAAQLGLHGDTLRRWLDSSDGEAPSFVSVLVAPPDSDVGVALDAPPACQHNQPTPGLTLTSPTGFRLEGLTLSEAVTALRRLS
jgi:hypothetical protein